MNRNKLATTATILATALSASPAEAVVANGAHEVKLTPKEQRLNQKVQRDINGLVKRIIAGPVDKHGGESVFPSNGNTTMAMRTVTVGASNPDGGGAGEYAFSVLAPLTSNGGLDLKKTQAVILEEGYTIEPGYSPTPYAQLVYVKNEQNNTWALRGDYQLFKTIGTTTIEAAVKPELKHEARLNDTELSQFTEQANNMVDNALQGVPVSPYQPAFNQPPNTQLNPLK